VALFPKGHKSGAFVSSDLTSTQLGVQFSEVKSL